ncbi:MAG TPA: arabinofuranosidase catalytic domain-containing protein [Fibrobacteria bacterium]|nr:arabinofuranosidase catalytic domain-containing protein [Fibrobacteria bacterium]HOX50898.1 arabinofuranosidase catalytic domain-containing protein [Fibrobacteria bacterium]
MDSSLKETSNAIRPGAGSRIVGRAVAGSLALAVAIIAGEGPCDIYAKAGTPCVGAFSTTRALYADFNGPLIQVRDSASNKTKDIYPIAPGGVINKASIDSFVKGKGSISMLYDQSPKKNHLPPSPRCNYLEAGLESDLSKGQTKLDGNTVPGIYITGASPADVWVSRRIKNVAYRNNAAKGTATGNQAETMYMVVDGKRYSEPCCFSYGNGETTGNDDGNGTMESIYWGTNISWGGPGEGKGPWIAADLENGMYKSDRGGHTSSVTSPNNKTINVSYASLFLKGPAADSFGLKAGDAQTGKLTTMWNGKRPTPNYYPKKLQGAIFLGTGGDGSPGGTGTFYEGVITIGNPPDSIDDQIQANIVAAGYGRQISTVAPRYADRARASLLHSPSRSVAIVEYDASQTGRVDLEVASLSGKRMARISHPDPSVGTHQIAWDASTAPGGLYALRLTRDAKVLWTGQVLIER